MKAPAPLLALLVCILAAVNISATTLVVTKTEDTNDGVCDADCSLREAVAVAAADDSVVFSSLFNAPQTITLALGQIAITRNLSITGSGSELLAISGNNATRIFRISGTVMVNLTGMKLTNGLASNPSEASGGAISVANSTLILTRVNITNNIARSTGSNAYGYGGGIYMDHAHLTVADSSISNNLAVVPNTGDGGGGGIYSWFGSISVTGSHIDGNSYRAIWAIGLTNNPSVVTIEHSTIDNNAGNALFNDTGPLTVINSTIRNNGGGILGANLLVVDRSIISGNQPGGGIRTGATATVTDTTIRNNFANGIGAGGGGISNNGTMYVLNSSITENRAFESGGGVKNTGGHLYLTNSTVSGNFADNGGGICDCPGGGIFNGGGVGGVLTLTNVTITDNRAGSLGGGLFHDNSGTVVTRNTIIAGNLSFSGRVDASGVISSQGFNLVGNTNGNSGWILSDLLDRIPLFAPLASNGGPNLTHAILPSSPAINAGNEDLARNPYDNSPLLNDGRGAGFLRSTGGAVDIGAYEANYAAGPVTLAGRAFGLPNGRGIPRAYLTATDDFGNVTYAQTNPLGFYRFPNLLPAITYTIRILHKSYLFDSPQVVTIDQPRDNFDFVAQGR